MYKSISDKVESKFPPIKQDTFFSTKRHIPHWQIGGRVYFITFSTRIKGREGRTDDDRQSGGLSSVSRQSGGLSSVPRTTSEMTNIPRRTVVSTVNPPINSPVNEIRILLDEKSRRVILNSFQYWHKKKVKVHIVIIMPDHVHAIIEPLENSPENYYNLSKILHSIKSFTAHEINKILNQKGHLWEEETWDRIIRDEKDYYEKWNYILYNPVKSQLCEEYKEYPFIWIDSPEG